MITTCPRIWGRFTIDIPSRYQPPNRAWYSSDKEYRKDHLSDPLYNNEDAFKTTDQVSDTSTTSSGPSHLTLEDFRIKRAYMGIRNPNLCGIDELAEFLDKTDGC